MKALLTVALLGIAFNSNAQGASVEKSTCGIQIGVLGIWAHNEFRLSNQIALRNEIGFDSNISGGPIYDLVGLVFAPVLTIEPKWYYNLNKRISKSKGISANSGNFVSLNSSYHPDWFFISNNENNTVLNQLSIIPTWGIRRNIGKHFNYESGIGLGYRYIFTRSVGFNENVTEPAYNLHLRIGYRF